MKKIAIVAIFLVTALTGWSQISVNQPQGKERGTLVKMATTHGEIVLLLYDDTPKHRENFTKLASVGFYNGLLFHRVIRGFMIQGGDPESRDAQPGALLGNGTTDQHVPAEISPKHWHKRGALCAARMGDDVNPKRDSSPCQFYIVQGQVFTEAQLNEIEKAYGKRFTPEQRKTYTTTGGAPHLDGDYTVFGEVVSGMEVVDMIANEPGDKNNRPLKDVRIMSVEVMPR